jgi:hypothetical protein
MARKLKKERKVTHIEWSWPAFLLGPLWYLRYGMWRQALIMLLIILLGDKIMIIPVALYCALRFTEDLQEFRKEHSNTGKAPH